jgi:hypothetical protein
LNFQNLSFAGFRCCVDDYWGSSGLLCGVGWHLFTDFYGQPVVPIFKGQLRSD